MFNNYPFNTETFNASVGQTPATQSDIVYNGFSFQDSEVITSNLQYDNGPKVNLKQFYYPRGDGGSVLDYTFPQKEVTIRGFIKSSTAEGLNNKIDEMKRYIGEEGKDLDIKVNGNIRRAKAYCINMDRLFNRQYYDITRLPFQVKFRTLDPFFKDITKNIKTFGNQSSSFQNELYNFGSAKAYPVVTFTVNSITNGTKIEFSANDRKLIYEDEILEGDFIKIDCEQKIIINNLLEKNYSGTFPIFKPGNNPFNIDITADSFDIDINIYIFNSYL